MVSSTRFYKLSVQGPCPSHLCVLNDWHMVDAQCIFAEGLSKGISEYMNVERGFLLEWWGRKSPSSGIRHLCSNPGCVTF